MNDRPKDAVVLAAGRGTRMKELTRDLPKPMLPIGDRPLLGWILDALRDAGIERAAVITGYRPEQIESHFGDGSRTGLELVYRRQEVQDGTARALLLARDAIGDRPFVLAWGDILTDPANYRGLVARFVETGCDGVLSVNRVDDPYRGAAVYVGDDWRIEKIVEKPPKGTATTPWLNSGIGLFRPIIFHYAETVEPSPRGEFELPDAVTAMLREGRDVRAFPLAGFWSDVGTPEDLAAVRARLTEE